MMKDENESKLPFALAMIIGLVFFELALLIIALATYILF